MSDDPIESVLLLQLETVPVVGTSEFAIELRLIPVKGSAQGRILFLKQHLIGSYVSGRSQKTGRMVDDAIPIAQELQRLLCELFSLAKIPDDIELEEPEFVTTIMVQKGISKSVSPPFFCRKVEVLLRRRLL